MPRLALVAALPLLTFTACKSSEPVYYPVIPTRAEDQGREYPYSSAVRIGEAVFLAGDIGIDPATGQPPPDPADEARQLLDQYEATLARLDMTMDDLIQVQVYCSDLSQYDSFNREYVSRFKGKDRPARAFIGTGPLLFNACFEMIGVALKR
ncbi:MAG: RidA family protein [Planctomycetota bacterium]|jgi:enamine deaminase RidA (YjgF/YER057c/UK114 family)